MSRMSHRHTVPPETEKEQFILGLNMPQLMWGAGGLGILFGTVLLLAKLGVGIITALIISIPLGLSVLPFMFYRPKKRTLSLLEYLKLKWDIKRRNNELPNKSTYRLQKNEETAVLSTEKEVDKKDVRNIDITLGGGN